MKPHKANIIFLSLFQLLVFIYPILVKSDHHHLHENYNISYSIQGQSVSKTENFCPICNFEFVKVLLHSSDQYGVFQIPKPLKKSDIVSVDYNNPYTLFSVRAPPLS